MYQNKKIMVFGMARSGYAVAKVLSERNNEIIVTDAKEQDSEKVKELENLGIKFILTTEPENLLDETFDYVIKNPGISYNHKCILKANELGIKVINEVEVAYNLLPDNVKIIGITGSNGKTTTTTLTYLILKEAGLNVHIGGNIGMPLCGLLSEIKSNDILVLEISDHQLVDMYDFKTDISVLTNLYQNHLDFHGSYEKYISIKKKIFNNHRENDLAIINNGSNDSLKITDDIVSTKKYFSAYKQADCCIENDYIVYNGENIININDIKLQGKHNYENIMCAIMIAKEFNVKNDVINTVLTTFGGVEHRIEFVRTYLGRDFYNDSKSTNTDSTIIAVDSFTKPTILIMGGLERGHSFDDLNSHMKNVKMVVCYGETKNRINDWCHSINVNCEVTETLKEAIKIAWDNSKEGDIILLSPACASWDQYKDFEVRGNEFKNYVNNIK